MADGDSLRSNAPPGLLPGETEDEHSLLAATQALMDAELRGDVESLTRLIAADYVGFDPSGAALGREAVLGAYRDGAMHLQALTAKELRARVLGSVGLLTGISSMRGSSRGHSFDLRLRFTDVWERRDGVWQLVASQVTPIATS